MQTVSLVMVELSALSLVLTQVLCHASGFLKQLLFVACYFTITFCVRQS
jgi:hypothetical protein